MWDLGWWDLCKCNLPTFQFDSSSTLVLHSSNKAPKEGLRRKIFKWGLRLEFNLVELWQNRNVGPNLFARPDQSWNHGVQCIRDVNHAGLLTLFQTDWSKPEPETKVGLKLNLVWTWDELRMNPGWMALVCLMDRGPPMIDVPESAKQRFPFFSIELTIWAFLGHSEFKELLQRILQRILRRK